MNSSTELALNVPSEAFMSPADIEAHPGLGSLLDEPRIFEGREAELLAITRAFEDGAMIQALWGLGGVGKTTLASQWAVNHTAEYHPVWWIDGGSAESITAGFAGIGRELQDVVAKWLPDAALRERAKQWLLTHSGWLLVLDNVNNPDDVRFLKAIARNRGRVLITTRLAAGWHDIATAVPVHVLSADAAVQLFTKIYSEKGPRDTTGVKQLCAELGYLALAIQQAAAYCLLEDGMTADRYLEKMAEAPDAMHGAPYEGRQLERTMAGVWEPSLDRLGDTPLAGDVLRTLAWFPPAEAASPTTRIPRAVLNPLADKHPPALLRALGRLAAHSLIRLDQEYVYVHRVVQAVARTPSSDSIHRSPEQVRAAQERAQLLIGLLSQSGSGAGGTR
ncbi:MAG: hypothetical protein HOV84_28795 [Streptomyces sp.]|nr:hypothetical protein [Streptomyces sp.]